MYTKALNLVWQKFQNVAHNEDQYWKLTLICTVLRRVSSKYRTILGCIKTKTKTFIDTAWILIFYCQPILDTWRYSNMLRVGEWNYTEMRASPGASRVKIFSRKWTGGRLENVVVDQFGEVEKIEIVYGYYQSALIQNRCIAPIFLLLRRWQVDGLSMKTIIKKERCQKSAELRKWMDNFRRNVR